MNKTKEENTEYLEIMEQRDKSMIEYKDILRELHLKMQQNLDDLKDSRVKEHNLKRSLDYMDNRVPELREKVSRLTIDNADLKLVNRILLGAIAIIVLTFMFVST